MHGGDRCPAAVTGPLLQWGRQHFQKFPWREPGIAPWQALLAEVFLQRTRAPQAARVFVALQRQFPTVQSLAQASVEELHELMQPLGLRWRVPLVGALAQELADRDGLVPTEPSELLRLSGVGPYAAAATLSLHLNRRAVLIDANVVRVLSRLIGREYGPETRRSRWIRELAERLTPVDEHRAYNYALLDLAMTVCLPRRPLCADCPMGSLCVYWANLTESSAARVRAERRAEPASAGSDRRISNPD